MMIQWGREREIGGRVEEWNGREGKEREREEKREKETRRRMTLGN
jgi:hypothetical protein